MVKTRGPALSLEASGSLGADLTFSTAKGRSYLKLKSRPKDPKTALQISTRAMTSFLTKAWSGYPQYELDEWTTYGATIGMDAYSAYRHWNLERWGRGLPPTHGLEYDWYWYGGFPANFSLTVEGRTIRAQMEITTLNYQWGVIWYRGTTLNFPRDREHTIHVRPELTSGVYFFRDTPPGSGQWRYSIGTIGVKGSLRYYTDRQWATMP